LETKRGPVRVTDYASLRTRFNYMAVVPQGRLLSLLVEEAARWPGFRLKMLAPAQALIVEDGVVRGVRHGGASPGEVRALLTVGADGRFSKMRELAGLPARASPGAFDALWFTLPREPGDEAAINIRTHFGRGYFFSMTERDDHWQVYYVILKGSYPGI